MAISPEERERIVEAAHKHAEESCRAQGLPLVVTDTDVLRKIATLIRPSLTTKGKS